MEFAARLTRMPRPFDADRAAEARVDALDAPLAELVAAAAGSSPYLAGLIAREADWLPEAFDNPEAAVAATWALHLEDGLGGKLRQSKRRVALMTALADLGGVWSLSQVTDVLSRFADAACDLALKAALAPQVARGKLPGVVAEDLETAAGLSVFAMGKMGAHELNYSSDIDLICLFDENRHAPSDYAAVRSGFVKAVRQMCATLSDIGPEGYVFRTDLRLRPDAGVTPVALAMGAAERYYESLGRTWERAAWIKARPCAGDLDAGAAFQDGLRPFVWRRHLDFAAIRDAHDMRLAIRDAKGLSGPITLPGHDMKLGRGGIREIEFFTQTRQLIAGGRDPTLRVRGTIEALDRLAAQGWVPPETATTLQAHYTFHRTVEHRLQMVRDAQTHSLPKSPEEFARIAAMMDMTPEALTTELRQRLEAVHETTESFFAPNATAPVGPGDLPDEEVLSRWRGYPAFRSPRAQDSFERIRPRLAQGFKAAARPEEAVAAFSGFLSGLPAGVQLFALFEANPSLVDLLVDILTISPPLAAYLSRNARVLDAVIGGGFFEDWPDLEALESDLAGRLARAQDYEAKLDEVRRWQKEWHFRIGVHHLRGLISAEEAAVQYADLARTVVGGLWPEVIVQFAQRHGPPPGRGAVILGMGSIGAGRLSPTSDLDMIVVYDPQEALNSEGQKPLDVRSYYARLTKAMVTALSAHTAAGGLYEVDMRLRPSGNQGPVATSLRAFREYQTKDAWLWEHLALTRATVLAGPDALAGDVTDFLAELLARAQERDAVLKAVRDMRARIAKAKPGADPFEVKAGPGRLQDIEILAQAGALMRGRGARDIAHALMRLPLVALLQDREAAILHNAYVLASNVKMALNLVAGAPDQIAGLGSGAVAFLCRAAGAASLEDAAVRLEAVFAEAAKIIDKALMGETEDD